MGLKKDEPGLYARYRFYTAGQVPRDHHDWAARRLGFLRWVRIYVAVELATLIVACAVVRAFTEELSIFGPIVVGLVTLNLLLTPISVMSIRARARRELAPPPAAVVLAQIGEPIR